MRFVSTASSGCRTYADAVLLGNVFAFCLADTYSMIRKSGRRFSEKIMLNKNLKRYGDST